VFVDTSGRRRRRLRRATYASGGALLALLILWLSSWVAGSGHDDDLPQHARGRASSTSGHLPSVRRRRRVLRWLVIVVVAVLVINVLLVGGVRQRQLRAGRRRRATERGRIGAAAIRDGGPIVDTTGGRARSLAMPDRTVALTFDDGPDPTWTPRVLEGAAPPPRARDVLPDRLPGGPPSRPGPATRGPMDTRSARTASPTHGWPGCRSGGRNMEYAQTQMAIAYATGVATSLLRRPTPPARTRWATPNGRSCATPVVPAI
jgi:hypothetical protein